MQNNRNKFTFNGTHLRNIENKFEKKTGIQLNHKTNKIRLNLRKPVVMIALMVCFTMLVSATAIIIHNQPQYIPFLGFVDSGEYENYYTPEILKLGKNTTVETVIRVKDGKASNLSIIITDTLDQNIKIITEKHGEFNLTPVIDYRYSSFGTMTAYSFDKEGNYTSYGYYIQNFPNINEFTLTSGNHSIEVKLVPSNSGGVVITEDSGVKIKSYSMAKGSKALAYEIYENNCDFEKILGGNLLYKTLELGSGAGTFKLYDENGNKVFLNGYDSSTGPDGLSTVMFLRTGHGKISKMAVDSIRGSISTSMLRNNSSIEDIPIPADGEKIIFDGGLLLYDSNGLICKAESVTRKGNEVTIYTNTEYSGEYIDNIENIDIYMKWYGGLGVSVRVSGWVEFTTLSIKGNEEFIKLYTNGINYRVNGNWEITFE